MKPTAIFILQSFAFLGLKQSGAEGSRTPVQTYSSKAFYMLISLLLVGRKQEMNKPIPCVAE